MKRTSMGAPVARLSSLNSVVSEPRSFRAPSEQVVNPPMSTFAPIFLVGCPRSGTTLVRRMLDAHPQVAIAPETFFVYKFWRHRRHYGDLRADANLNRLLDDLLAFRGVADVALDGEALREKARRSDRRYRTLFALFLRQFAEERGAAVAGEKTPNHVFYLRLLQRGFPAARFVHVLRDARAVANSWRGLPWSSGRLWRDAARWREHVAAARRSRTGGVLCTVRFERLVRTPERELRRLCAFLGLDFVPAMLRFHEDAGAAPTGPVNTGREPWKKKATRPLDPSVAEQWKGDLTPAQVAQVEGRAGREMRRWGYAPQTPRGSLAWARAETQVREWAWMAGRAARALGRASGALRRAWKPFAPAHREDRDQT